MVTGKTELLRLKHELNILLRTKDYPRFDKWLSSEYARGDLSEKYSSFIGDIISKKFNDDAKHIDNNLKISDKDYDEEFVLQIITKIDNLVKNKILHKKVMEALIHKDTKLLTSYIVGELSKMDLDEDYKDILETFLAGLDELTLESGNKWSIQIETFLRDILRVNFAR